MSGYEKLVDYWMQGIRKFREIDSFSSVAGDAWDMEEPFLSVEKNGSRDKIISLMKDKGYEILDENDSMIFFKKI